MNRLDSIREAVLLALDQLRGNKFRSAITILGVVIGVATVMGMSAVVAGIRSEALAGIRAAGPKNFMITRFDMLGPQVDGGEPYQGNPKVTIQEAELLAELSAVRAAIPGFDLNRELKALGDPVDNVAIAARGAGWHEFTIGTFSSGHNYLPADVRRSAPVIVLSKPLAEKLYGPLDPVGRQVKVGGRPFRVVGVFDVQGNIFGEVNKHFAVLPYTSAWKYLTRWDELLAVFVVTADDADQEQAIDQVVAALRTQRGLRPGQPNNFAIMRQEEILNTFNRFTTVFFAVMIGLSSVALLVGGVGVIAIMMISVSERTREIGVRMALGAKRREILWQFLFEASTLTVIGGALGMLLGGAAAFAVQALTPIPARVPIGAIVAALVMAAIAGIVFGMWPAWRASRMDPVVALRYE